MSGLVGENSGVISKRINQFEVQTTQGVPRKKNNGLKKENVTRRRWLAFPLGLFYGVFVFLFINFLILDSPSHKNNNNENNSNNTVAEDDGTQHLADLLKANGKTIAKKTKTEERKNHPFEIEDKEIYATCAGSATFLMTSVGSFLSKRMRGTLVLMLPSLFAKRGRAFLLSTAIGIFIKGPIKNIDTNINTVVDSFTCMYEEMEKLAKKYMDNATAWADEMKHVLSEQTRFFREKLREMEKTVGQASKDVKQKVDAALKKMKEKLDKAERAYNSVKRKLDKVKDICNGITGAFTFGLAKCSGDSNIMAFIKKKLPNIDLHSLEDLKAMMKANTIDLDFEKEIFSTLQGSSLTAIKESMKSILKNFFAWGSFIAKHIEKVLYLSAIFLITDARSYLRQYYTDNSFDNKLVDSNVSVMWEDGQREKLTPLRNWEKKERFQNSLDIKLSREEKIAMLKESIPVLMFFIFAVTTYLVDLALVSSIDMLSENGEFAIGWPGMEFGVSLKATIMGNTHELESQSLNLRGFNLSTARCMPKSSKIDHTETGILSLLMLACFLSIYFQAFASRLRAKICNAFYPKRASERARFLYNRIQMGRTARRQQLHSIVKRRLDAIRLHAEISNFRTLHNFCCSLLKKRSEQGIYELSCCPGCEKSMLGKEGIPYKVKMDDSSTIETTICQDCGKDANVAKKQVASP